MIEISAARIRKLRDRLIVCSLVSGCAFLRVSRMLGDARVVDSVHVARVQVALAHAGYLVR